PSGSAAAADRVTGSSTGGVEPSAGLVITTLGGRFGGASTTAIVTLSLPVAPMPSVPVSVSVRPPTVSKVTCSSQPLAGKSSSPATLDVHPRLTQASSPPGSLRSSAEPRSTTAAPWNTSAPSEGAPIVTSGGSLTTLSTTLAVLLAPS